MDNSSKALTEDEWQDLLRTAKCQLCGCTGLHACPGLRPTTAIMNEYHTRISELESVLKDLVALRRMASEAMAIEWADAWDKAEELVGNSQAE